MYYGDFSVRIPEGKEVANGYVKLPHNTQFRISMRNNRNVRCDACVEVNGEHVGTWRIGRNASITVERPVNDESKFTFFKLGTREGRQAGLSAGNPDLGLVKVEFRPEVRPRPVRSEQVLWRGGIPKGLTLSASSDEYDEGEELTSGLMRMAMPSSVSAGGVGLSGHSNQTFYTVQELDYDYEEFTTINLRLVCDDLAGIKPLGRRSTPVPPPIR